MDEEIREATAEERAATAAESTALTVSRGISQIEAMLGRISQNDVHRTEEYNAVAGTLLRIEHSRKKADDAVNRLPELVARVATIERWLIHLADAVSPPNKNDLIHYVGKQPPIIPTRDERLEEWADGFQRWLKAGGRPDAMPGVEGPMSPMGGRRDR